MQRFIALALALAACQKPDPKPEPLPPDEAARVLYASTVDRLFANHLEGGWVVTRRPDGSPEHMGDSLLWTGLAMYAVPCDRGAELEAHLVEVITRNAGALVRYEPLGEYAGGREASLDGALGLYRGIVHRITACGSAAWQEPMALHFASMEAHGGRLNPSSSATLEVFYGLAQELAYRLGAAGADPIGLSDRRNMERAVVAWAWAVQASHAAAFRVHLGWLILEMLEALADVSDANRAGYCAATTGMDIPVVDHYCGRGDLAGWVSGFQFDAWEYRHQRAGWESADGDGDQTPALDLLVGLKEAYSL